MKTKINNIIVIMALAACAGAAVGVESMPKHISEQAQDIVSEVAEDRVFDAAVALRAAALYAENAGNDEDAAILHGKADRALEYIVSTTSYTDREMDRKLAEAEARVVSQSREKTAQCARGE